MSVPTPSEVLAEAERTLRSQPRVALCQIVRVEGSTPGKGGWKMLLRADGTHYGNLGGGAFEAMALADAAALLGEPSPQPRIERYYLTEEATRGQPTGMVCGGMVEVYLEVLAARPLLAICGGGPVGQALARQAALCDFEVAVADDREPFRRAELFPPGTVVLPVDRDYGDRFLEPFGGRELSVAVVTRCWETDLAACRSVLDQQPEGLAYLGLMGSRRKVDRVVRELEGEGFDLADVPWHAPIGLEIGGDTPAEIAVSIAAELVQERSRRQAGASDDERPIRLV